MCKFLFAFFTCNRYSKPNFIHDHFVGRGNLPLINFFRAIHFPKWAFYRSMQCWIFKWWILCFTVGNCQATLMETGECPTVIECDTYMWQPEPWGPCLLDNSVRGCGRGERNRIVHCYSNRTSVSEVKWVHYLRIWKTGVKLGYFGKCYFTTSHS